MGGFFQLLLFNLGSTHLIAESNFISIFIQYFVISLLK